MIIISSNVMGAAGMRRRVNPLTHTSIKLCELSAFSASVADALCV